MDSINNADEKPTDNDPPLGPLPPHDGRVNRGERLAQEVKKLPTAKNAASAFGSLIDQK